MRFFPIELLVTALPATLAASGAFNILQMNVAGLPEILNRNGISGGKDNAATELGHKFSQYGFDVIHVQEDFHYHKYLYGSDTHPFRTESSGDVPFGSGLNTLSNFDWTDYRRIRWDRCGISSGDCFTGKGFTFMRVVVSKGVTVDMYNVHADAGDMSGDYAARRDNLQQLADYISEHSAGQATIVFGDTNTLYSRETAMRPLEQQSGLQDVWVELEHGGVAPLGKPECPVPATDSCETLDTVMYRSGDDVKLSATNFEYITDMFLRPNGELLSDHNPVLVDFSWSMKEDDIKLYL